MLDAGEEFIAADGADTSGLVVAAPIQGAFQATHGDFAAAVFLVTAHVHLANIPITTSGELATWECRSRRLLCALA